MRAFFIILLIALIFENTVVAETNNKPNTSNINRKSTMNTEKQTEEESRTRFKRATYWKPSSIAVLNVDKGEMETFSAYNSTWGPSTSYNTYSWLEEVLVLLDSNDKMTWAGWKRDVYLKIGDRIIGCYAYTDSHCCILRGRSGLDVDHLRVFRPEAFFKTNNEKKTIDNGPNLEEFDRLIYESKRALHSPSPTPVGEAVFFLKLQDDGVAFLPKPFRDYGEFTRKYYIKPGVKYQHDDIRPEIPLPLSYDFGASLSAQPLAQAHSILRVSMENDEICFEIQNTERRLKGRVWIDKKKLLNEKIFEALRVMDSDGTVRIPKKEDWERMPVKQASKECIMEAANAIYKEMQKKNGTK